MLIVASLGINTEMPDMDSCLKARAAISSQDASIQSLCIPKVSETDKMREMFDVFLTVIDRIKEYEIDKANQEDRFSPDCTGQCQD
ncbi:uncharacterized protein METZ01_LOCUS384783 [marine metagenome]|uniref:Uncharacterized protein n=1 Tax=marine metagenome TaxID=408172 RepID=A0A382UCC4_9ZZZZ